MRHEDIIKSNRMCIVLDIIAREGFEFSVVQLYSMLSFGGDYEEKLWSDILERRQTSTAYNEILGYSVLFWGSNCGVDAAYLDTRVHDYYATIGAIDYYRGLIDEGTADCA